MRLIKKVKYDGSKVFIEYFIKTKEKNFGEKKDSFTLESTEKPLPELKTALNSLKKSVEIICEFPEGYSENIDIRGVSFSWGGSEEVMGASITGLKTLKNSNAPLCINTPHLPEQDYNGREENNCLLPSESIDGLQDVIYQAERFLDGERDVTVQENLFTGIDVQIVDGEKIFEVLNAEN